MTYKELKKKKKADSKEQLIFFEPSLADIQFRLCEPITWMMEFLNSL